MNVFLACFLAIVLERIVAFAFQRTLWQFIAWRARRGASRLTPPSPLFSEDMMRAVRAQADAELALAIAADAYALSPGQGTLDQLTEAAAAFGKTQTPESREMRMRVAEMRARCQAP